MLSLTPGTPGRSRQMPRTISSISTPAWEAAYRARMQAASTREFICMVMRPGRRLLCRSAVRSISSMTPWRRKLGATRILR